MIFSFRINNKKRAFRLFAGRQGVAFCLLASVLFCVFPALAEEDFRPFDFETKKWVDLDSYAGEGADSSVISLPPVSLPSLPSEQAPSNEKMAEPARPLDLPSLPAMKPVETLEAPSTEEENKAFLADKDRWKKIENFDEESQESVAAGADEKNQRALSVRFPFLPSPDVKAIPDERISKSVVDRQKLLRDNGAVKKKTAKSKPKLQTEEEAQACEALNDYRRRQLEAMESDRQTLSALRKALSELGLQDRLKFMADGESVPKTSPEGAGSQSFSGFSQEVETQTP